MNSLKQSIPVSLKDITITDGFWSRYVELVRDTVIPYQWDALNDRIPDAEPSHAIKNFRIAAGEEQGDFHGYVFQDSDLAKWLEAVGYSLAGKPDPELERLADEAIDLIGRAQQPDGYLNTYFTIREPEKRWTNLNDCHELYCAGHMMEAAVAYYNATGKRKLLDIMCRFADHIDSVLGPEPEKLHGYPGHEEVELALVKLYNATKNEKYLKLAKYFIDQRGQQPHYFDLEWEKRGKKSFWSSGLLSAPDKKYNQSHLPVREQTEAVGHAVRAVYLYTGMAEVAAETGDKDLLEACMRLWDNIENRQMYITGGIGSTVHGEAFSFDYDLPNDTVYSETCASIGLVFFAHSMLKMQANSHYADVMERALYNAVSAGMSLDGKHFFYVNPLEVWPEACEKSPIRSHVRPARQKWFGCACCPPNIARLLSSLGKYIYTYNDETVYTHLYISGEAFIPMGGDTVRLVQRTNYPWDGNISIQISSDIEKEFALGLRIPGWCRKADLAVNGEKVDISETILNGYVLIKRKWNNEDRVELHLDMPVELIQANPKVRANAGKVAIQRGPLVYCLEEADNGENLSAITLPLDTSLTAEFNKDILGGIVTIKGKATRKDESTWQNQLYRPFEYNEKPIEITAVPYYIWGNRKPGEMLVWIHYK